MRHGGGATRAHRRGITRTGEEKWSTPRQRGRAHEARRISVRARRARGSRQAGPVRKTVEALVSAAVGMAVVGLGVLLIAHHHPSAPAAPNLAVTSRPVAATPARGQAPATADTGGAGSGGVGGLGPAGTPNGLGGAEPNAPAAAAGSTTAPPAGS